MSFDGTTGAAADAAAGVGMETGTGQESQVGASDGTNPAWGSILEKLPTSLHSQITPELQKWDQGVQNRFQDLQSKYDPYKSLVEEQVDPAFVQQALALANAFNQNPRGLYDQIVGVFGEEWGLNGQPTEDQGIPEDVDSSITDINKLLESNPQLKELADNQVVLAQYLMEQEQEKQSRIVESNLDNAIASLTEKYGDTWDPDYVFTVASQDPNVETDYAGAIERAIVKFQGLVGNAPRKTGPSVVAPSSSVPSDRVDIAGLSSKDARSLVAHLLSTVGKDN